MRYIKLILQPGERVYYNGVVHPVLYLPGIIAVISALLVMKYLYPFLLNWPVTAFYPQYVRYGCIGLSALLFLRGVIDICRAFMTIYYTELVVTDRRVIAKFGVVTTTTMEIDRRRIAETLITQTLTGKMLGYGWIILRGFSGNIGGLPPITNPYGLQQAIYKN